MVAVLKELGGVSVDQPGGVGYDDSRWKVITVLRGKYGNEEKLSFFVWAMPNHEERPPSVGHKYILISDQDDLKIIRVILDYSDASEEQVSTLLSKSGP